MERWVRSVVVLSGPRRRAAKGRLEWRFTPVFWSSRTVWSAASSWDWERGVRVGAGGRAWVEEARELAVVPVVRDGASCLRAMCWGIVEAWWEDCIGGVS